MWLRKSQLQTPITINNLQQGYDFDNSKNVCSIKIDGWRFVQAYKSININWGKWLLRQAQKVLKLQEVSFRTILINNWTQRAVEQHFGDLKHNYFNNGRLERRDDFVYDYHSSNIRQKRFAELF